MNNLIETLNSLLAAWGKPDIPLPDFSGITWLPTAGIIFSVILGFIYCFLGYKAMRFVTTLVGFALGLSIGYVVAQVAHLTSPLDIIVPIAGGIVFALLGFFLYRIGIFFAVFLAVFGITVSLLKEYTRLDETVVLIVALVVGVILAILSVVYLRPLVIVSTAISGGMILANEIYENLVHVRWSADLETMIRLGTGLLLALIGMIYQFRTTRGEEEE
jgi:hypothetical protein